MPGPYTRHTTGQVIDAIDINELQDGLEGAAPSIVTTAAFDDFVSNTGNGALGWNNTLGVSSNSVVHYTGHPGVLTRSSGATASNYAAHMLPNGFDPVEFFDVTFIFAMGTASAGADVLFRVGIGSHSALTSNPSTAGAWLEKLAADTAWWRVTRNASVQTRETTGINVVALDWIKLRIRRISSTSIGFTMNNASEVAMTTNLPSAGQLVQPFFAILGTTTTARTVLVDLFTMTITGLAR